MARLETFYRLEWEMSRRPDHLYAILYAASLAVLTAYALPYMPSVIPRLFQRTLQIGTWADIALFNLYAGTYVITLLASTVDLLRVWILPREEGYLSLYLSKPVAPPEFLKARFYPVLVNATLIAAGSQAAAGLSVWHIIGPFDRTQFLWSSGLIIALILFLLCLFNWVFLYLRESYYGIVVAMTGWTVMMAPASLYVYRPDLFSDAGRAIVFPANLLWYQSTIHTYRVPILASLVLLSALFVCVARLKMRRSGI